MPLSRDPARRAAQLANLRNAPPAPLGNRRTVRHGGTARVVAARLDEKVREVFDALALDAPLRDADGGLPAADTMQVRLLAECLCRLDDVSAYLRSFGLFDERTRQPRPALEVEQRLRREAADYLDAMGMSPRARAKLGLVLARTVDMATAMSEPDPDRRAELLRQAGVPVDEDAS